MIGFLRRACYSLGMLQVYLCIERYLGWKRAVFSVCFHSVPEESPAKPISNLESGTCRNHFENQIKHLSKWLQPINDSTLLNWLNRKEQLKCDGLLVTFDDGYKNNQTVAGPILEKYGAPGLIFIPTDFISTGKTFWWTRVSDVMRNIDTTAWKSLANRKLPKPVLEIIAAEDLASWPSRLRARRRLAMWIDQQPNPEPTLTTIESVTDTAQTGYTQPHMSLSDWDDITAMSSNTFNFGSHTHTHPHLTKLTDSDLEAELETGRQELSRRLGQCPISLAYPAGDFDERVAAAASDAGFELAFTTVSGIIDRQSNRMQLPRIYLGVFEPYRICFALVVINIAKYIPKKHQSRLLKYAR